MTTYFPPKKNMAFKFYVGLIDQSNTKLFKANPTIASGDFKVSTDGGAFANLTTLPSANPASGRAVMIDLSASEMNGDNVVVQCVDASGAEWCDLIVNLSTVARQIDDLAYPATSGRSMVVDASGLVDANMVKMGPTGSGTAQTARDVGANVLISSGTGSGQLNVTSGVVDANAVKVSGTAQTGRDLGASVLLSPGTGTGQLSITSGVVDASVKQVNGDATAAASMAKTTRAIVRCTVSGSPSTTSIPTSACAPAGAVADEFKGRIITFDADTTTTALRGQATDITANTSSATPTFTVTALTTAPASGDTFSIT